MGKEYKCQRFVYQFETGDPVYDFFTKLKEIGQKIYETDVYPANYFQSVYLLDGCVLVIDAQCGWGGGKSKHIIIEVYLELNDEIKQEIDKLSQQAIQKT